MPHLLVMPHLVCLASTLLHSRTVLGHTLSAGYAPGGCTHAAALLVMHRLPGPQLQACKLLCNMAEAV